jgi:hypothetical protein
MSEKKKPGVFDVRDACAKILVEQNRIERLEAKATQRASRAEDLLRSIADGKAGVDEARRYFGSDGEEP